MDFKWPGELLRNLKRHPIKTGGAVLFLFIVWASYQFGGSYLQEKARQFASSENDSTTSSKHNKVTPGALLITHYPTGELFVANPENGRLALVTKRLGEPSAIAIRFNGEIVVLDSKQGLVIGVDSTDGSHTFVYSGLSLWGQRPTALSIESETYAVIAVQDKIIRMNLQSGEQSILSQGSSFTKILGLCVDISGKIIATDLSGKIIEVDPRTGNQHLISESGILKHPRAPIIESPGSILVGTAGHNASIVRIDRATGQQTVVATGPFVTIGGMALADDGCIYIADNGRGTDGSGFIAKFDAKNGDVRKIVTAQTSEWQFLNGRAVAIFPNT